MRTSFAILLALGHPGFATGAETTTIDPAAIEAQIAELRVEDVAWRSIPWRPCLVGGLREAREAGKPAVLWVFIDRPIDDKRC